MITILLVLITVVAVMQPTIPRFFAAMTFALLTLIHDEGLGHLEGLAYYGSAALIDFVILFILAGIQPIPRMVLYLQLLCILSMLLNFGGWLLWVFYLPPNVYDNAFQVLYGGVLIALLAKDNYNVGAYTRTGWVSCFHYSNHPWLLRLQVYKGKIWSTSSK